MEHYIIEHQQDAKKIADLKIPVEDMMKHPQEVATLLETLPFLDKAETGLLHFLQEKVEEYEYYYNTDPDGIFRIYDTDYIGEKMEIDMELTLCKTREYDWSIIKYLHIEFYKTEDTLILRKL